MPTRLSFTRTAEWIKANPVLNAIALVAVCALFGSVLALFRLGEQSATREADRIASDIAGCERGNDFRSKVVLIGAANAQLINDILDILATSPERRDEVAIALAPAFNTYQLVLETIQPVNCESVVPQ